ncbi:unnamed protein product [Linum trigynum]|uniref:Uncharacterized protein n=1 Tax=Linum trigynum TaxID=586398 RepID=A0AAV2E8G8_9ROSI
MGINGGIVRSAFSRTRSTASSGTCHHHGNGRRSNGGEKKRWSVVRSYLCGDEFNSVQGEEDSATVSQCPQVKGSVETQETMIKDKELSSTSSLFLQEDAAIIIQTAFRKLMARRQDEEQAKVRADDKQELHPEMGCGSLGRYSVSTSIEVQTGNSVDALSITEENNGDQRKTKKASRCQDFMSKEDWNDSTLSSNVLKMRIQNRLDATNRRERALAYALSQQLRICSREKQARTERTQQQQPSMSWHWLERWMATRAPEFSFESHSNKQSEQSANNNSHRQGKSRCFDLAVAERESCGSNEVPVPDESSETDAGLENGSFISTRKRTKPVRSISRRKTAPCYQCPPKEQKTVKKSCASLEHEKDQKLKRSTSNRENKCKDASASYNYGNIHFLVN